MRPLKRVSERLIKISQLAPAVKHKNYIASANHINLERQLQSWDEAPIPGYANLSRLFLSEAIQVTATLSQFAERITNICTALADLIQIIRVRLELSQQQIQGVHVGGVGNLGQHHDVQVRPGGGDHVDHIEVGPRGGPVVDPHPA